MKLYFLRHGLAGDPTQWQGDDRLRPLTQEGKDKMKQEAENIAMLDLELDRILTSPLVRALQTAEIVAERLVLPVIQDERLSPGCKPEALESILKDHPEAKNIMLVGHEPDFSGMLTAIIGGGRLVCKKGGLARVDIASNEPLQGELVWLIPPKLLYQ